ncbi:hypothetical protein [Thiomonas sp.]
MPSTPTKTYDWKGLLIQTARTLRLVAILLTALFLLGDLVAVMTGNPLTIRMLEALALFALLFCLALLAEQQLRMVG